MRLKSTRSPINKQNWATNRWVKQAYALSNQPAQQKRLLQDALNLCPDFVPAHHNLGVIYENEHNDTKALYHYRQALKQPMPLSLSRREEGSRKNIYHVNHRSEAKPTIFVGSVGFAERRWFTKKLNLMALSRFPIERGHTESAWVKNRRVVIMVDEDQ
jgi:tetratricopeptide (TPR) repeat protein